MQEDNQLNAPMKKIREQLDFQQPSEKSASDVLEAQDSGANAESQFVHSSQEELNKTDDRSAEKRTNPNNFQNNSGSSMPTTERLTEND